MIPLKTEHRGIIFRSRLEARWAVFFDSLDWKWSYESQSVPFKSGTYTPDFYLNELKFFAEVKPDVWPTKLETDKMRSAATYSHGVLMLQGHPAFRDYWSLTLNDERLVTLDGEIKPSTMERELNQRDFTMRYHAAVEKANTYRFDGYDNDREIIRKRYT
jgi:hypothetical protein